MPFLPIWERICSETEMSKLKDLAELLGVTGQFISKKKREDIFPVEWAFKVAQSKNLLTEWIMTGKGPRRIENFKNQTESDFPILNTIDVWLKEIIVTEPNRREWFNVHFQDSFPMFKEWIKNKEKNEM